MRVRLPLRLNIMIAKAAHEDHEVFYIRGFVYFRALRGFVISEPIRSAEASMIFSGVAGNLAQIDPGMPQRIDDGRRRAIDWHLANALGAERAVFVRISSITTSIAGVSSVVGMM